MTLLQGPKYPIFVLPSLMNIKISLGILKIEEEETTVKLGDKEQFDKEQIGVKDKEQF